MKRLLPLLLLLAHPMVSAESGTYRVEVIVFENLAAATDVVPVEVDEFRNFASFPAVQDSDLPEDLIALQQISDYMDGVWRRLRSSRGYRPLVFTAWEQNRTDYYPPMRIHDEIVLDQELRAPTNIMIANLEAEDPLAAYMSTFYRLDGTVQLRRSRFLHLFLDLELRQETAPIDVQSSFFSNEVVQGDEAGVEAERQRSIFPLRQNRQIRSGRLHYFDTPTFGVLVFVTALRAN